MLSESTVKTSKTAKPVKTKKTVQKTAKRESNLSKKQLHTIYSRAASKAWITIYQNKIRKTKDSAKLKAYRARLAELKRAA